MNRNPRPVDRASVRRPGRSGHPRSARSGRSEAPARPSGPPARTRVAVWALGLGLPVVLCALASVLQYSWRGDLPDPVAVHWSPDAPDGFAAVGTLLAGGLWAGVGVGVVGALVCWWCLRPSQAAFTRRMCVGTTVFLAALFGGLGTGIAAVQRGVGDAHAAPDVMPVTVLAMAAGLLLAAGAAWLVPGDAPSPATGAVPADAPHVPLRAQDRAVWTEHVTNRTPVWIVAGVLVAVLAAGLIGRAGIWWIAMIALLALVLGAALAQFTAARVTVDAGGLTVRGGIGGVLQHVPLEEVVSARVVQVSPLREFGGWGVRTAPNGRVGVVMRAGPAVEVRRTGGRTLVVTADGASRAAALLNSLADRARR